ncbi:DUF6519 domain-containing protein [Streptomyces yaizuensis]|uniref:DUF6519 domain-containing protein n=1 Tax=Streptomyces yaizuensis TaxID=2989713 RepID=A0ABQ5NRX2_9ACTN|nr:DUF6519 domain-containing protein [Streptomyces sp. YSPA8]GLF93116.1 DUF6519 domain-containing protein [Streptomyces sp. YSPA8]
MHADLSRVTFRPDRPYAAVIAQQGRVQLDADANEQAAIQLVTARRVAADLIGPHGGPAGATGFAVGFEGRSRELDDLTIGGGRYYVAGIPLDATRPLPGTPVPDAGHAPGEGGTAPASDAAPRTWTYWDQPDAHRDPECAADRLPTTFPYLVHLTVWERSVTAVEDPLLREVGLGPAVADTSARIRTVWQVLPLAGEELGVEDGAGPDRVRAAFADWSARQASTARLAARTERPDHADDDPCALPPESRYRGPENQLYRVEIHEGGQAGEATFKWSRENGSVALAVECLDGTWAELASLGGDDRLGLQVGDWVEPLDTAAVSRGGARPLLRIEEVDLPGRRVRLSAEPDPAVGRRPELHPFLRRWDHRRSPGRSGGRGPAGPAAPPLRRGAHRVEEGSWLPLEDGVFVWFEPGATYRTGDFWTVAARTATGDVEWPADTAGRPLLQPSCGIRVHRAPLAWVLGEGSVVDLRLSFAPLAVPVAVAGAPAAATGTEGSEGAAGTAGAGASGAGAESPAGGRSATEADHPGQTPATPSETSPGSGSATAPGGQNDQERSDD